MVPQKLGALEEPGASVADVRTYFGGLVRDLLSPEGRQGCLLVNSATDKAAEDDEVAAVVRGHLARLEKCFTAALRTAVRRGEVPASVDPAGRAKLLVATSQGLMVAGKASPDEEVLRAIVDGNAFTGLTPSLRPVTFSSRSWRSASITPRPICVTGASGQSPPSPGSSAPGPS